MPSNTDPKTILLKGCPKSYEAAAAAAITPGQLLELTNTGAVQPQATQVATFPRPMYIAREEEYVGGSIDTAYAIGDRVPYYQLQPGDEFWGFLEDEHAAVAIGQLMETGASGTFQAVTTGAPQVQALEAKSAVGGPAVGTRIRLRVI